MARQLWLLRHGDAEPHGTRTDAERRLTERGERQADAAGRALAALGISFGALLTSPRTRALDTARLAAGHLLGVEPAIHESLSSGFSAGEAQTLMAAIDDSEALLLVGHEPDFSQIVHDLTGARIDLKKGGVAVVRIDGSRPQLIVLLRPHELEAIEFKRSRERLGALREG